MENRLEGWKKANHLCIEKIQGVSRKHPNFIVKIKMRF